jgi:hypothetical protein
MAFKLVQSGVYLAIVELLRALSDRSEHQGLGIIRWVNAKDVEYDGRCRPFITAPDDIPITDDKNQLPLVVVVQIGK